MFNATHPINTAENKIVRAAMPRNPPRGGRGRGSGGGLSGSAWAAIITFAIVAAIGRGSQASAIVGVILALIVYVIGKWPATAGPAPAPTVTVETSSVVRVGPMFPQRITQNWIDREVPNLSDEAMAVLTRTLHERGWRDDEIAERVLTRR